MRRNQPHLSKAAMDIVADAMAPTGINWLNAFAESVGNADGAAVSGLFQSECYWRDYLPFGQTLQTIEGVDDIGSITEVRKRFQDVGFLL